MATAFRAALLAGFLLARLSSASENLTENDWPTWRGAHQNGTSPATGLVESFDPDGGVGSNVLWKSEAAAGISTPIVMNGRLFTIVRDQPGTPNDAEKVLALDAESGEVIWENVYNVFLSDLPAERVGWSHVTGDPQTNRVYSLGACCLLQCIDAETGKTLWQRSMSEQFGMLSTYGGRTNTPVVFENLVIISGVTTGWDETARPAHRFFAFDKLDGKLVWWTATRPLPEDTTYSTPVIKKIGGQDVMVAGSGDGNVYGIQPRTGKILWRQPVSRRGINTSVAIDDDGHVFATHGEENPQGTAMGAVVCIDAVAALDDSASAEKWRTEEVMCGKSSPLLVGNRLYVVEDSAKLRVLDCESGQEIGNPLKLGTAMRGSLLYADGKIYACTSQGIFHVLRPADDGVESVFKVRLPRGSEVGGSPIVAAGKIYLPTTLGLYCLGQEAPKGGEDSASPLAAAAARGDESSGGILGNDTQAGGAQKDARLATLQLVPAEAIVTPGDAIGLEVSAFNLLGERLAEAPGDIRYEVQGAATVSKEGVITFDSSADQSAVYVTAKSGELSATARFRVVGSLPWSFDFSNGEVPITWVGARYRHEARTVDGEPVIVKISTIPKGTRSQTWFGPTDLSGYTITADVKASGGGGKLPDMGVIGQRYVLDLMGESQQLQIRTWAAQLRMAKSEPFAWKAGVWYSLKLQASVESGNAVLRGKVWPREESEPQDWTVTATDSSPNLIGSPGLFGNATNAEIVIDNVKVVANE